MFSLKDKVAVVTGGAGDLGFSVARSYIEAGAKVVLFGRDPQKLDKAIKTLGSTMCAISMAVDVADAGQVTTAINEVVRQFGRIDILVTAAGVQHRSPILAFDHAEWNEVLKINLSGTFYCAQAAAKHMVTRKTGRIIMITSLTAEIGIPNISAYAASRGGIRQLCKTMAVELAPDGVTVNCVGPGRFHTSMTKDVFADDSKRSRFLGVIPMGRAGVPEDLSGISVFLASDASSYITGQSIYVDGGWLAGGGNISG